LEVDQKILDIMDYISQLCSYASYPTKTQDLLHIHPVVSKAHLYLDH